MTDLERSDHDLDPDRFPHELRRAIEGGPDPVLVDQLPPGLSVRPIANGDVLEVVTAAGAVVGELPLYRLRRSNPDMLHAAYDEALAGLPVDVADQVRASVTAGDFAVLEPPDADVVVVAIAAGSVLVRIDRSRVVAGWPQ